MVVADESLVDLIQSYLDDDEVALMPGDPAAEVRANTWGYGVPAGAVDVPAVGAALERVTSVLRVRLSRRGDAGTFYSWYDAQAGQLRCSLSSAPPDRLPFGGPYRLAVRATEVVALAAADDQPGLVAWSDLADADAGSDDGGDDDAGDSVEAVPPLVVWAVALP
ncbi:hypothetical protein Asera_10120 [Actinocatenispora sera]|uniref:Uncharacterized protein n=1 Tax=Actinocatenispora sera TaxID=390989 RepID=A0A810KV48_9ACTN|nr:hypothetical protein Asera_10120 [Actinocatenispora sera]